MTDTGTGRQAAGTPVQATGKAIGAGLLSTLALLMGGLAIGCLNAWHWVSREDQAMHDEQEKDDA